MNQISIVELVTDGLILLLYLSLPILTVSILSSVISGILASYTKIVDPSINQPLKFLLVFLVLLAISPWLSTRLTDFATNIWQLMSTINT